MSPDMVGKKEMALARLHLKDMKGRDIAQKVALLMTQSLCASSTLHSPHSLFSFSRSLHQYNRFLCTSKRSVSNTMQNASDLDPIFQQKQALRSKVRKDLKAMTPEQRSEQDIAIQNIVLEAPWLKSSTRLCAYISCDALREVDTSKILSAVLSDPNTECQTKKKLYVPRVEDKNSHMRMFNISSLEDLIANSMNILEPAPVDADGNQREDVMQASDPVDLILLPGLAFDRSGQRLGRGGGYYDLFLKKYQELAADQKWKQPLLVGLSYSLQILDEGVIAVTSNDMPVDALVSPDGVIRISPAAFERM